MPSLLRLGARSVAVGAALLLVFLAHGLAGQNAPTATLTLLSKDGRRALPLSLVGDQEFVALDDLAAAFQVAVHEESGAITVSYKGRTIVLTPDQALASVAGKLVSLPAAPARSGRRWLVPVEFISRALAPIYDVRLDLRKPSRLLVVGDLRVPRVTVRFEPLGSNARLTIDATPRAPASVAQQNERLTIRFDADAIEPALPAIAPQGAAIVQGLRVLDPTTIGVDLGPRFGSFRVSTQALDASARIVVDLVGAVETTPPQPPAGQPAPSGAAPQPAAPGAAAPAVPPGPPPDLSGPSTPGIRTIVIDPGHGGEDEGARGPNGTKEKDVTLAAARRVKALLEARLGVRVLLTRDEDRAVPLDTRAAVANNNKADLFVSLHTNTSLRKGAAGASIWYAAFDQRAIDQAHQADATAEHLPTFGGGSRDIELVLWDLAQVRHVDRSAEFARILAQQLDTHVPLAPHVVERAPLRVLESANMPAVIAEMGYLSNADQEPQLASDAFQGTFAQAVLDAVVRLQAALTSAAPTPSVAPAAAAAGVRR